MEKLRPALRLLALLVVVSASTPAAAGSIPDLEINQTEQEENVALHPTLRDEIHQVPNPLMDLIQVVTAAADLKLADLEKRLANEPNNSKALEIIRSMEQIKVQVELDILATQASYARRTGREEIALEIEEAITLMTTPRPTRQPVDRPAPPAGRP